MLFARRRWTQGSYLRAILARRQAQQLSTPFQKRTATLILADTLERRNYLHLRLVSDLRPVFFFHIFIDLDDRRVERICSIFLATGNPVMFPCLNIVIVGLKASSRQRCESLPLVVNRLSRFREGYPTDSGGAENILAFIFHVGIVNLKRGGSYP